MGSTRQSVEINTLSRRASPPGSFLLPLIVSCFTRLRGVSVLLMHGIKKKKVTNSGHDPPEGIQRDWSDPGEREGCSFLRDTWDFSMHPCY